MLQQIARSLRTDGLASNHHLAETLMLDADNSSGSDDDTLYFNASSSLALPSFDDAITPQPLDDSSRHSILEIHAGDDQEEDESESSMDWDASQREQDL